MAMGNPKNEAYAGETRKITLSVNHFRCKG